MMVNVCLLGSIQKQPCSNLFAESPISNLMLSFRFSNRYQTARSGLTITRPYLSHRESPERENSM